MECDEDFYSDYEEAEFELNYGVHMGGGEYYYDESDFIEWKATRTGIRPYDYHGGGGEVARYRLLLTLNEVGRAFLTLNAFLEDERQNHPILVPPGDLV
jgi:hypothetical protein